MKNKKTNELTNGMTNGVKDRRRTKILATLGPACSDYETLINIARKADAFRINFSHADHANTEKSIKMIQEIGQELKKEIAILGDTKGPEIRTTNKKSVEIKPGKTLNLLGDIGIDNESIVKSIRPGDRVLMGDGVFAFDAIECGKDVKLKALTAGNITLNRKVTVPGRHLNIPFMDKKDEADLNFMKKHDFDYIAASFVSTVNDIEILESHIGNKKDDLKLITKIETGLGVENLEKIMDRSYGIMVARGDLGVEIPFELVPSVQSKIIRLAREQAKLSIVATHMLKSMTDSMVPTRAEVSDVTNAVREGADAVMLSEETAAGHYPIESIEAMDKIIIETEKMKNEGFINKRESPDKIGHKNKIAYSAIILSEDMDAPLVAPTMYGNTPRKLSRYRPRAIIHAVSPRYKTARHLSLFYGCQTLVLDEELILEKATKMKKTLGLKHAIFVFGYPAGNSRTNSIVYL